MSHLALVDPAQVTFVPTLEQVVQESPDGTLAAGMIVILPGSHQTARGLREDAASCIALAEYLDARERVATKGLVPEVIRDLTDGGACLLQDMAANLIAAGWTKSKAGAAA